MSKHKEGKYFFSGYRLLYIDHWPKPAHLLWEERVDIEGRTYWSSVDSPDIRLCSLIKREGTFCEPDS
jgi:hypothetical protein